jgi:hypothetical protein
VQGDLLSVDEQNFMFAVLIVPGWLAAANNQDAAGLSGGTLFWTLPALERSERGRVGPKI